MNSDKLGIRRTVDLPLVTSREMEARLRAVFHRAMQQMRGPGLALGLLACTDSKPIDIHIDAAADTMVGERHDSGAHDGAPGGKDAMASDVATARDTSAPDVSLVGFEPRACDGTSWNPVAGLRPVPAIDYASVKVGPSVLQGKVGEACKTASDKPSCVAMVNTLEAPSFTDFCNPGGCRPFIVTTAGDRVTRIATQAELLAFLGSVDTAQEAALVAYFLGYDMDCKKIDVGGIRAIDGGWEVATTKRINDCPIQNAAFLLRIDTQGTVTVLSQTPIGGSGACIGRRPEGLQVSPRFGRWTLATFLGESASLEAASVPAFVTLARDLTALGAPRALFEDALQAADDEIRHAKMVGALAARAGGHIEEPRVIETPPKDLTTLALENAVEGCVRETFGALVAQVQADKATDRDIARVMRVLAEDETRHAALAHRIAAWAEPQLNDETRARVAAARRQAIAELRAELAQPHAADVHGSAGFPLPDEALALVDTLEHQLWHAA